MRDYSSAKDDIERALQARLRGEPAPPATTDPSPGGSVSRPAPGPDDGPTTTEDEGAGTVAAPPLDGQSASAVPIPLLVLAALALLLVAGGSAGYLVRRLQARRLPPPA